MRNDDLNERGMQANHLLKTKCAEYNMGYIENDHFKSNIHLNNSGIHLNFKGSSTLAKNFIDFINL